MFRALILALLLAGPAVAGEMEDQVLVAVNAARAQAGCGALQMNSQLASAAKSHANAMATQDFFGHDSQDGSRFSARIKRAGYHYSKVAENIAAGQSSAAGVMKDWLGSSGHRKNMLDCAFTEIGIALAYQPDDAPIKGQKYAMKYYWVQDFGRP